MSGVFGADGCELETCFVKRYGGTPDGRRRIFLLLRRDRLAGDGRMRCVAATEDIRVAEQWRAEGPAEEGRSWEAVECFSDLASVLRAVGE